MAFPSVSLLDSMIRAAEKPLSNGGIWALMGGCATKGEVASEAWKGSSAFPTEDGAYYTQEELSGEVGTAFELHLALSNERYLKLWACTATPDVASTKAGYYLQVTGEVLAGKVKLALRRWEEGTASPLAEKAAVALAVGDRVGISAQAGRVIAWKKAGAGAWEEVLNVADATFTQGFVGITAAGNTHAWRNLEAGGTVTSTRLLTPTQKQTGKLSRAISRTMNVAQPQQATAVVTTVFVAAQGSTASSARSVSRTLPTIKPKQVASLRRVIELPAAQGSLARLVARPGRRLSVSQGEAASMAHSPTRLRTIKQASSGGLAKALARTLVVVSTQIVAPIRPAGESSRVLSTTQGSVAVVEWLILTDAERKIREEEELRREREREEREAREREEREPHVRVGEVVLSGTVMS